MELEKENNALKNSKNKPHRGKPGKPRRPLWRRIGRVVWVVALSLLGLTVVQVLLGTFVDPPLTPLMVQRLVQQASDPQRPLRIDRQYVPLDSISPLLVTAVVHSEDGLFMYHNGFDIKQMKLAYRENRSGRRFRGGSTISQQTAKNAFLPHSRTMLRKAAEAWYTMLIEAVWGKRRIMEVYLNIVEFGDGIYGAEAASRHYFGHSATRLTRTEAAQLAATLPAPLTRNPGRQTPWFRRQTSTIAQHFSWGMVDIDMPKEKRREKRRDEGTLAEFLIWMIKNR